MHRRARRVAGAWWGMPVAQARPEGRRVWVPTFAAAVRLSAAGDSPALGGVFGCRGFGGGSAPSVGRVGEPPFLNDVDHCLEGSAGERFARKEICQCCAVSLPVGERGP
jgi:hypothetical protein